MSTPDKISKAKARLIMDHPFFASLLLRTEVHITAATPSGQPIELAATDGRVHYYNPEFLDKCSVEDVMAVLCHEVGHDSLLHSLRLQGRNAELWNIACDHAINLMLEDQGLRCPKAVPNGWLADQKYKGWSADRIYADLQRNPPPSGGGGHKKCGMHGDLHAPPSMTEEQHAEAVQAARQRVAAAAGVARLAGKLRGDLARMVDEMLETKVDWTDVLREFMRRVVKRKDNWSRRNRRHKGVYLPTRRSTRMGPIVFIPDTSGSMWGDDMEKICSEMAHCAAQTSPEGIRVVWADTRVAGEQEFKADEFSFKALEPKGGGGTDMRVPLKHVEQYDPQVVVLMTDGHTPWPDAEPPYPTIVLCTTDVACPIGEVIRV